MTYATLMVHADPEDFTPSLLRVSADVAALFKARVIGVAACTPILLAYGDQIMDPDMVNGDRAELEREMNGAEARFRGALQASTGGLEWRSTLGTVVLADYVAEQGRAADLLIVGPDPRQGLNDSTRHVPAGELVMRIGRPVLIVPPDTAALDIASVMIAWKDTRETRRAIADARPLLRRAGRVVVVEVAAAEEHTRVRTRLADVVAWLARHDIAAEAHAAVTDGNDAVRLDALAREHRAGLLVAGAYGHTRVREWVLGGVTRDLLRTPGRCVLLSH